MISPKRIAEMKVLLERRGVSDTGDAAAYRVALRDAIAEIEELQATLARYDAEPALARVMDRLKGGST